MGIDSGQLEDSWTAVVVLHNGQVIALWHTAWPSSEATIKEVLSISSDYPRGNSGIKKESK